MDTLTLGLHKDYLYYASSKWLYYPERVACIKRGNFREVMPVTVQLIPSLYCNFCCPHCCYGRSKESIKALGQRQGMLMDLPTMTAILDRIHEAGIQGVVFTGGGEPTLNPHLVDGMRYAVQKGLKVGLFTNGSLLTRSKIHQLLELEPSFIRVSLDAGTPHIHRLLHGYSDKHQYFSNVLDNIEGLAKEKLNRNANTTIGVGVTVEPINLYNLVEVTKRVHEIFIRHPRGGVDYLVFRPTVNYQRGKFFQAAQPLLDYVKEQTPEYFEAYRRYLYEEQQLPAQLFEKANQIIDGEVSPLLQDTGVQVITVRTKMLGVSQSSRPFQKCRASPWYIFVGPDGTVYNCAELGLDPRVAIGNLLTHSLAEIWKSDRRQEVMDFIDHVGLHTVCPPICLYYELNQLFEKLDEAMCADDKQRCKAVEWIEEQESLVQAEMNSGIYSQPHREFI